MTRRTALSMLACCVPLMALAAWRLCVVWPIDTRTASTDRADQLSPFHFTDIAAQAGVRFTYFRGETGKYWITETTGGGVALVDYDSDGWLDILVSDGCLQPPDGTDRQHSSHMFRNQHDGTFADVTGQTGTAHTGYGQGCFAFDYDNDGFDDLYLTCWGPNALFRNNGDGTYGSPAQPGRPASELWSTGAVPADFDRDGDLDLMVVNYLDFDHRNVPLCGDPRTGVQSYCGPKSFGPTPSVMLRNAGDGSFDDVSRDCAIVLPDGSPRSGAKGLGAVAADLNDDGWLDIYVANDMEPNFLFLNRSADSSDTMRFDEVAVGFGVATSGDGAHQDSMGVACGDYNGDGRLDLLVTNYYLEGMTLYKNMGVQGFVDATRSVGLLAATRRVLGWGVGFFDFDNDSYLDVFAANGHVQPDAGLGVPYAMPAQLFRNVDGVRFQEVSSGSGPYFNALWNGRGSAFGDIDNDGDVDVVVVHHHQAMAILRNDSQNQNHWLRVVLVGRRSDRSALGARLSIITSSSAAVDNGNQRAVEFLDHTATNGTARRLVRQTGSAGSYLSANDSRVHIGVGLYTGVSRVEVQWPSGVEQLMRDISCDGQIVIREP